ncbi:MAG: DUF5596 domain-containing protein [Clostridia bacterium]|nr:DUF5596 domain-containing protein [Clostridia bacterium]
MIRQIAERLGFPSDAIEYLTEKQLLLKSNTQATALLDAAIRQMYGQDDKSYMDQLSEIADITGIHRYTVDMLFFLACADPMRELYRQKDVDEEIYWNSLSDLKYKLLECKRLHGIYGSFTKHWFPRFLRAEAFALGRLQYELKPFPLEAYGDLLKEGDIVCNCHIPSSGPLLEEDVIASLKQAYRFYEPYLRKGVLPITCHSWLLFPPIADLFGEGSNLDRFYRIFEILDQTPNLANKDFWRVFYREFSPETLPNAPEDSSLQRKIKQFLLDGGCMGNGRGLILFDGEKILTQR